VLSPRSILLQLLLCILSTTLVAQDVFYIDSTSGQDLASVTGNASSPFETLTYAVSRSSAGNSVLVHCLPGVYEKEVWPLQVTTDAMTVQAVSPGSVLFTSSTSVFANFRLVPSSGDLTLRGLSVQGGRQFVRLVGSGALGDQIHIILENMDIHAETALQVTVGGDAYVNADVRMCEIQAIDTGFAFFAHERTHVKANIQRCTIRNGTKNGVEAIASDASSELEINIENTVIRDFANHAILVESAGGASNLMLNSCNLVRNGIVSSPRKEAVSLVRPNASSSYPHAVLMRNILSDNGGDLRDFGSMPWNFTFESNLVQDQSLSGLGGNIVGDAAFVGSAMVLGARSDAWGAAPVGGLAEDYYGNIRDADGRGDIGAFEHKAFTFGVDGRAPLGDLLRMGVSGQPNQPFLLYAGWSTNPGQGLQVNPMPIANPGVSSTLDAAGAWSFDYHMPNTPAMAGRMSYFQVEGLLLNGMTAYSQVIPVLPVYDL